MSAPADAGLDPDVKG